VATLLMAGAFLAAAPAGADPEDLVPWCSAGETPTDNNCRVDDQQTPGGDVPGANPDLPLGVDPGVAPIV